LFVFKCRTQNSLPKVPSCCSNSGKVQEFRLELLDDKKDPKHTKKRNVLKRIVANMTMGNDMSPLFPDVIGCMGISDLEIKKMIYLYLVNYSKSKPDVLLMSINSFLKVFIKYIIFRTQWILTR
jgi:vesicle coat complex subunit